MIKIIYEKICMHLRKYWSQYAIFIIGIVLIHLFFLAKAYQGNSIDSTTAGQFGDLIGGYLGTIFALLSTVLLFSNLLHQIETSEFQQFQNKHFEMIKLHRANLDEMILGRFKGRPVFIPMMREWRALLKIVKKSYDELELPQIQKDLLNLTYLVFFYGIGKTSTRILKNTLTSYPSILIERLISSLEDDDLINTIMKEYSIKYKPFQGHQSRLGHYFRNLYQIVKFVHFQKILSDSEKYDYVRSIRTQLSNHEQAFLLLNIISDLGHSWRESDKDFLKKYKLIRNIPNGFFSTDELKLSDYFPLENMEYFEINQINDTEENSD